MRKTNETIGNMLSLVSFKYGRLTNEEIVVKIKENFNVTLTVDDILNYHVLIEELSLENKKIEYYDSGYYNNRQEFADNEQPDYW